MRPDPSNETLLFGVYGAGSIGCFLGGKLAQADYEVILLGRESLGQEIAGNGLRITDLDGDDFNVAAGGHLHFATDPRPLADCDVILVTTKSLDTARAAGDLAALPLRPEQTIISFQNGIGNADILRAAGLPATVLAGMVPYNVVRNPGAHFHCGTTGHLMFEDAPPGTSSVRLAEIQTRSERIARDLAAAGLAAETSAELPDVLWGKLVFNLNNAINALSGLPLREQLAQRSYRRIIASAIEEALAVMRGAGVRPRAAGRMIPWLAPHILRLPDWLFFRVAAPMVRIDPQARSSMWADLARGRRTEIDFITGAIVALAAEHGLSAPIAAATVELVKAAEESNLDSAGAAGRPGLSAAELAARLGLARG